MARSTEKLEQHPLGCLIPKPSEDDRLRLKSSIQEHGYLPHKEIVLYEGSILDGWTRYEICGELGIEPPLIEFSGTNPVAFVWGSNIPRRHLTPLLILKTSEGMRELIKQEIAERKRYNGRFTPTPPKKGGGRHNNSVNKKIAKVAGVSPSTVANYHKVQVNGSAALKEAVDNEEVSISDAAAVVKTADKKKQTEAVQKVKEGKASTLKEAVAKPSKNGHPTFNDAKIEKTIGALTRMFDERGNALGKGKHLTECQSKLDDVLTAFRRWQKG